MQAGLLDHLLIAPKNISYHNEHHFYPSVPFYRLPELHRELMQQEGYRAGVHLSPGYLGVIRECLGKRPSRPAPAPPL